MDYYKAKEMYNKYHCSLFSLFREEGGYEEFVREYNADIRVLWAKEFLREDIDKFRKNPTFDNYYSISMVIANHHDMENLRLFADLLKETVIDDILKFHICDDILGMRNLNTRIGILDYAEDAGDQETFDYLLSYAHKFIEKPGVIPEKSRERFEDMKPVIDEYDKIQARKSIR